MKLAKIAMATVVLSSILSSTALAGTWAQGKDENQNKWWYDNGDGTYAANGWQWIDGNDDQIAECYYFDSNGWLLTNTTTPDGCQVNENGAWINNGIVESKQMGVSAQQSAAISGNYTYYGYVESNNMHIATAEELSGDILMKHVNITAIDENTISVNIDGADIQGNNIIMKKQGNSYITYSFEAYQPEPELAPEFWIDQKEIELHLYELTFDGSNQISTRGKCNGQLDGETSIYLK